MPVTTRSSNRPNAAVAAPAASAAHSYSLRSSRPATGFYAEVDEDVQAAAVALLELRNGPVTAQPIRRSARISGRS